MLRTALAVLLAAVLIQLAPSPQRYIEKKEDRAVVVVKETSQTKPLDENPARDDQPQPEIQAAKPEPTKAPEPKPQVIDPPKSEPMATPSMNDHQTLLQAAGVPSRDWPAAEFIFSKESTWRPTATNSKGCIGLGQNCPDKKGYYWLTDACPNWQTDPVCQVKRFSHYATERYGSWWSAHAFWIENGWW